MAEKNEQAQTIFSRRTFTRGAALTMAAAALPADLLAQTQTPPTATTEKPLEQGPKLSASAQAEAEAKINNILSKYGSRLTDAEKADVRKSMLSTQEAVEKLRAFPLENWDEPALILYPDTESKK